MYDLFLIHSVYFIYFHTSSLPYFQTTTRSLGMPFGEIAFQQAKIQDVRNEHHFSPTKYAWLSFPTKSSAVLPFQICYLPAETIHLSISQVKTRLRTILLRNQNRQARIILR